MTGRTVKPTRRPTRPSWVAQWLAGRQLVALSGGPRDRQWWWIEEWTEACRAARRSVPAGSRADYSPTGRQVSHPAEPGVTGESWVYTPTITRSSAAVVPAPRRAPDPAGRLATPTVTASRAAMTSATEGRR